MAIPTLTVTPGTAAKAYSDVVSGTIGHGGADFGGVLARAVAGVIDTTKAAEHQAMGAIAGKGNLTDVVSAVAQAELALQTTVAIRDRVIQAYQEIMRMPI